MSKYAPLWEYVQSKNQTAIELTFEEIEAVTGFPIDHSFLNFKKELAVYGYEVKKISMKNRTVAFGSIS